MTDEQQQAAEDAAIELYKASDYIAENGAQLGAAKLRSVADELAETHGFEITQRDD